MKPGKNVGHIDQYIRYGLAVVFVVLSFVISPWFFIGTIVFFVTAYFEFCGLYRLLGINTCKMKEKK
ncbi:MAG: DUF2892 domain-containing protein [Candidatus Moranbacteria bacterium]|nr:DUF2892 domain-containing protein [Candidatus Moranbacteria bacterium]